MVGEWMMDPIKIPWFRHPGSSWSLVYLVRGGSRPNLTEGSLSAAMGCFVQGYLVELGWMFDLMPLGSIRALAITRAPGHNRLSCGAIWRQNRRLEDAYHVLTGKRLLRMDPSNIFDQALALCELKLFSDLSTSANCYGGWMDFSTITVLDQQLQQLKVHRIIQENHVISIHEMVVVALGMIGMKDVDILKQANSNLFKSKLTIQFKCRSPVVQKLFKSLSLFGQNFGSLPASPPFRGKLRENWASRHVREKRARLVSGDTAAKYLQSHHARKGRAWAFRCRTGFPSHHAWKKRAWAVIRFDTNVESGVLPASS
ncbi:hypothetical protein M5K25_011257 [Dendrobium thyrsiflorum]|uniref:Uncharacterized protein n=1 Tax=Dendrobium thyrsiflorum TaxID=117978 RepID=A0ABD0V2Q7_DENTH